jgi:cyclophilin family peptidyl-prolyl cis-trans isomerase
MTVAPFLRSLFAAALCGALTLSLHSDGHAQTKRRSAPKRSSDRAAQTPGKKLIATLETSKGIIQFEMFPGDAPKTVENFQTLANRGYYKNIIFHRVISGFMIQGGDPTGTGAGGESAFGPTFDDEINPASALYQTGYEAGVVAMANRGPNTNGSQFFIMHKKYPLPANYTIFGRVIKGQEVVDAIATTPTEPGDRPVDPVTIISAKVTTGGGPAVRRHRRHARRH